MSLGISFTSWKGGKNIQLVGVNNYIKLFGDKIFWLSFLNNLKFIAIMLTAQIGLAFIFAIFVQNKRVKFQGIHRRLIFLPSILSAIVVAMI
ncbi:sugar ABC transporter permease, partial [Parabacteroides distasonis]|nr:sugar ABC transporter permease [Parabacteroides distasonis]